MLSLFTRHQKSDREVNSAPPLWHHVLPFHHQLGSSRPKQFKFDYTRRAILQKIKSASYHNHTSSYERCCDFNKLLDQRDISLLEPGKFHLGIHPLFYSSVWDAHPCLTVICKLFPNLPRRLNYRIVCSLE